MKWLYRIFVFLLFIPIQTLVLETFKIGGVKPDLALVFVFVEGWVFREFHGLFWGLALGGLLDYFSVGTLGVNFFLKGVVGFVAGFLGRSFLDLAFWAGCLMVLGTSILHDIAGTFFLHELGEQGFVLSLQGEILARAVYNGVVAVGIFYIFLNRAKGSFEDAGALFSPGGKSGFTS